MAGAPTTFWSRSQVALTVLLLASAGAAGKGFLRLMNADLGYDPRNTMSVPIPVHEGAHWPWADRAQYFEQLRAKIASIPQVEAAGISTNATPPSNGNTTKAEIMGGTATEAPEVRLNFISPEYFTVLHIPLTQGPLVGSRGNHARRLPLLSSTKPWRGVTGRTATRSARRFGFADMKDHPPYQPAAPGSDGWLRIVGVVADARDDGLRNPVKPAVYVPYTIQMRMFTQILVRARVAPLTHSEGRARTAGAGRSGAAGDEDPRPE